MSGLPGSGQVSFTRGELSRIVRRGLRLPGVDQLLVHAVGDRAIDDLLAALDGAAPPFVWRILRPRFEHGDVIHPEQIERVARLGVTVLGMARRGIGSGGRAQRAGS